MVSWLALSLSVLLLVSTCGLYVAYRHYGGLINAVPGLGALSDGSAGGAQNYLVVGSDSADGLTSAQLKEIGVYRSQRSGVRTDTILLVHVPAGGGAARFVSFPRDSYVPIPGHSSNKINSAYGIGERDRAGGGPALLIDTVQRLSGLHVDHYVQVSLYAVYTITNAVGGVDVCLTQPAKDQDANIDLPAGEQRLDGKQALGFVRQRHGLPGEDLGRIKRQQYFLGALTRRTLSAGVLLNPVRINGLLKAVGSNLMTDEGTSTKDLLDLGVRLRSVAAGKVTFQTVPVVGEGRRDVPGQAGASVVLLDDAALPGFFSTLDDPATGSGGAALTVPPSAVSLRVENGTGRAGVAGQVAAALRGIGFHVSAVGTASRSDLRRTVVRYGTARADSARTLAAALPGATLQADPSLPATGLVASVGTTYRGVKKVQVSTGTSHTPATTAADKGCIA